MKSYADRKEYFKAYHEAHRAERKAYMKAYHEAHRGEIKAKQKAYREAHRAERKAYHRAYQKAHINEDINSNGIPKNNVRRRSSYYLFNVLKHTKMEGYEIHHCFGYDDYRNFIYIPKALHLKIHQYLRDNNIDADTDHYSKIAHLVVAWDGYVYIKA